MINNKVTELEKAYFAGFFDGEGCVYINKQDRDLSSGKTSKHYKLTVTFGITYKQVLLDMKRLFGGSFSKKDMEKHRNTDYVKKLCLVNGASPDIWKQSYCYNLSGWDARCFLKIIEPYCREKKDQVRVGIEFADGKKPKSTSEYESKRGEFYYLELKQLKKEQLTEAQEECTNVFKDNQVCLDLFE